MKEKIALFCDVDVEAVITARRRGQRSTRCRWCSPSKAWTRSFCDLLRIENAGPRDLRRWSDDARAACDNPRDEVRIGLVGKYVEYEDSYKSLKEALLHGGLAHKLKVNIELDRSRGRGVAGLRARSWRTTTASWCRAASASAASKACSMPSATRARSKVPYFGICLGMQTAGDRVRAQRLRPGRRRFHRVRLRHAAPRDLQAARIEGRRRTGRHHAPGRLCLPAWPKAASRSSAYGDARDQRASPPPLRIQPRVRGAADGRGPADHRRDAGRQVTSRSASCADHPWFLGCQFHPEFKSKPLEPHPLFRAFIGAAYEYRSSA